MTDQFGANEIAKALQRARREGDGWQASCPVPSHGKGRGDRSPSLSIRDEAGNVLVHCHAGCSQEQVIEELRHLGVWRQSNVVEFRQPPVNPRKHLAPVSADAPEPPNAHPELGIPSSTWAYRDHQGALVFVVYRWDLGDGKKTFRQASWMESVPGNGRWEWGLGDGLRPLFNIEDLISRSKARVLICEGEKAVDAAARLLPGWVVVTSACGAKSAAMTDWSYLARREIVLWPDSDESGSMYVNAVAKLIAAANPASVAIIEPPQSCQEGWDAADAEMEGWSTQQVEELVIRAVAYQSTTVKAMTLGELLEAKFPPREMIAGSWLPKKGLALIYAKRGVGKTFFALSLAVAIANGVDFLGFKVPKARRTLYVDGEMPVELLQERLRGIAGGVDVAASNTLKFIINDHQSVAVPDISSPEGQAAINQHLDGVELVILDNLSSLTSHGKENEGESWLPLQTWALSLRRRGISVVFIHHAAKSGQQRGTSRREDVLDTVICLKHPEGYSPKDGARFEIHFEKSRSAFGAEVEAVEVTYHSDYGWITRPVSDELGDALRALKAENPHLSVRKLAEATGANPTAVHRRLSAMKEGGDLLAAIQEDDDEAA